LGLEDKRRGAAKLTPRKLSLKERQQVVSVCCSKQYQDLTPHQIVPILAEKGIYIASESTMYRILSEDALVLKRPARPAKAAVPSELKASAVNQLWSWDISYLKTDIRGTYFYLYLFMDIFSRAIVGWEIHESENGAAASDLFARLCGEHKAGGVTLHSDNGGPMRSSHMLATLQRLGVVASFSRPSVSNDNPYSESLFKTIKYTAGYPKSFHDIAAARIWMTSFARWYNHEHRHSRIGYVTPMQRHTGRDRAILLSRATVWCQARMKNPLRWTTVERSWRPIEHVYLKRPNHKPYQKQIA